MVTVDSVPGTGLALALQPDDSVVVAGSDTAETRFVIARYTTDGRLDTTFGGGAVSTDFAAPGTIGLDAGATTVIVAPDGKIIALGPVRYLRTPNTDTELVDVGVARYLPDGRPDTTLNGTGHILVDLDPDHAPHRVKAAPSTAPVAAIPEPGSTAGDATLLIGASVQLTTAGTPLNAVITRLRPDGTTDPRSPCAAATRTSARSPSTPRAGSSPAAAISPRATPGASPCPATPDLPGPGPEPRAGVLGQAGGPSTGTHTRGTERLGRVEGEMSLAPAAVTLPAGLTGPSGKRRRSGDCRLDAGLGIGVPGQQVDKVRGAAGVVSQEATRSHWGRHPVHPWKSPRRCATRIRPSS